MNRKYHTENQDRTNPKQHLFLIFLLVHQGIRNNPCNTATKAYHTMNQRTMVADHLQREMVKCNSTVTDVADGF